MCSRHETQHMPRLRLAPFRAHVRFRVAVAELGSLGHMRTRCFQWLFLSSLPILLSGCAVVFFAMDPTFHSHDAQYRREAQSQTDYVVGAVYRLKQPVIAQPVDLMIWGTYSSVMLEREGHPYTVQEYERASPKWRYEHQIAAVAKAGTLIRVTEIQFDRNIESTTVWIKGRLLLDIPWAKKPAELYFISKSAPTHGALHNATHTIPVVDKNILELVPKP